jgi:pentatricopeptide repeat protein
MPTCNIISWNAINLGYLKCGQGHKALDLFWQMQHEGIQPVPRTFLAVLSACVSVVAIEEGRRVHEQIVQNGYELDVFVGSSLIDMYAKCGSIEDAWQCCLLECNAWRVCHCLKDCAWGRAHCKMSSWNRPWECCGLCVLSNNNAAAGKQDLS